MVSKGDGPIKNWKDRVRKNFEGRSGPAIYMDSDDGKRNSFY